MSGNRKKRIAFVSHWARERGGAEYSLQDILSCCCRRYDCHLITAEDGILTERARKQGVTVHVVPGVENIRYIKRDRLVRDSLKHAGSVIAFVAFVCRLKRRLELVAPDLVHANVPKSHVALFCARLMGFSPWCLFHLRELFNRRSLPWMIYALLFPRRRATAVAISKAVAASLPGRIRGCTRTIHNGVAVPRDVSGAVPGKAVRFLYLGRVVPWKGCHVLVEALGLLLRRGLPRLPHLSIVGDTLYWPRSYRDTLKNRIAALSRPACCALLDATDDPDAVYRDHHVFCIASDREPFGRVSAEAQAHGLPVVGCDNGGTAEIVEQNVTGLLVAPGDVEAFADAMQLFVTDPGRISEMGQKGHGRVERYFNVEKQLPKLTKLFDTIMQQGAGMSV